MESPDALLETVTKEPLLKLAFAGALGSMLSTLLLDTFKGEETHPRWVLWVMMLITFAAITQQPIVKRRVRVKKG